MHNADQNTPKQSQQCGQNTQEASPAGSLKPPTKPHLDRRGSTSWNHRVLHKNESTITMYQNLKLRLNQRIQT